MRRFWERDDDRIDSRDSTASRFVEDIDCLLSSGKFTWAEPTLRGIQQTVGRTDRVTARQRQAVQRIERGLWLVRRR